MQRAHRRRPTRLLPAVPLVAAVTCAGIAVDRWTSERPGGPADFGTAFPAPPAASARATGPAVPAAPAELSIPRLGVRAGVDPVGVDARGRVAVPDAENRVGWYRFGPRPGGGTGSAVLVGHVDFASGRLGVLQALGRVRPQDRVTVRDASGRDLRFTVRARRTVPKDALADSGVFRRAGAPVLTLVTCTGPYARDRGGYQNNLVVTAVPDTA
jgi:sortase (surface protein transpeptidase)